MTADEKELFLRGLVVGLGAAKSVVDQYMPDPLAGRTNAAIDIEIQRVNKTLSRMTGAPVDGEAEYQSWLIQMELQSWTP